MRTGTRGLSDDQRPDAVAEQAPAPHRRQLVVAVRDGPAMNIDGLARPIAWVPPASDSWAAPLRSGAPLALANESVRPSTYTPEDDVVLERCTSSLSASTLAAMRMPGSSPETSASSSISRSEPAPNGSVDTGTPLVCDRTSINAPNYADNFTTASYDPDSDSIFASYDQPGVTIQYPLLNISPKAGDVSRDAKAIAQAHEANGVRTPTSLNPHTTPRLAKLAAEAREYNESWQNADAMTQASLHLLPIVAAYGSGPRAMPPSSRVGSTVASRIEARIPLVEAAKAAKATRASVDRKLATYLLDPNHPHGATKAQWFEKALGFTRKNGDQLAEQIVFDSEKAVQTGITQHGTKYNQRIAIHGANGRVIDVNFAWIRNHDGIVRLVTGIPAKK
jgi:hypothetical protein